LEHWAIQEAARVGLSGQRNILSAFGALEMTAEQREALSRSKSGAAKSDWRLISQNEILRRE
jgi:hypothetical protein